MRVSLFNPPQSTFQALAAGFKTGCVLALGYGSAFAVLAALRAGVQIIQSLDGIEGLLGTVIATAFSIWIASISTATLLMIPAALFTGLTWALAYWIIRGLNMLENPGGSFWMGMIISTGIVALLNVLVLNALGSFRTAFFPSGYLFWLGIPSAIFIAASSWACSELKARDQKLSSSPAGLSGR